jgi:hypothetical protein
MYPTTVNVFPPLIADASSFPPPLTFPEIVWLKLPKARVPAVIVTLAALRGPAAVQVEAALLNVRLPA